MPSLILRLEQLARTDAPPPATNGEPASSAAEPAPAATATATALAEPVITAVPDEPPEPAEATESVSAPAAEPEPRPTRVVDVASSERLGTATPLSRWSAAVAAAHDACFVLDRGGLVISISVAAVELLGCGDMAVIGRHVLDVINLVDLESGAPNPEYAPRITPLVVLDGPGLGRSLMRVRHNDGAVVTLDTASVPIHDVSAHLLGSVSFIAPIPAR